METIIKDAQLDELIVKVQELDRRKKDYVVQSTDTYMENGIIRLSDYDIEFEPNRFMHQQIATKLGIPWKYYERMQKENVQNTLDTNVNTWLSLSKKKHFLRSYSNEGGIDIGRAFLSDSYKPIDNFDVVISVLEAIRDNRLEGIKVESADVSEKNLYMRFINEEAQLDAPNFLKSYRNPKSMEVGNGITAGFIIKNSETGQGSFQIVPRLVVMVCDNGLIMEQDAKKKYHIGSKMDEGELLWSGKTQELNKSLIKSQVADFVKHFSSTQYLESAVNVMCELANIELDFPINAVVNATRHLEVPEKHINDILGYFSRSGDTNRSGVVQALTYFAHECGDPDLRYNLESKSVSLLANMAEMDIAETRKN
jgi:hypothetical protein